MIWLGGIKQQWGIVMKLTQKQFDELVNLIDDMGWDFDRFSTSGQETYEKICKLLGWKVK